MIDAHVPDVGSLVVEWPRDKNERAKRIHEIAWRFEFVPVEVSIDRALVFQPREKRFL